MTALTLRLDGATYERLRVEAFEKRTTITALIRAALEAPAEQLTADRETIADAIASISDHYFVPYPQRLLITGAVIAVLVPADVIRAETLEEYADQRWGVVIPGRFLFDEELTIRARAAEYRKAAGA